ncbi:DUF4124 domain-containing protein [Massilia sp. 9I]|uniref:DUF4124 domain-containing protein n=1 Tax=Massilia sp. 9I TaxID=2653152 RepID=UPI0012F21F74|nr:DUF4124 domain-containing protein [Massilia sp. 9I]VXC04250.1 conserved exported hypothetical protein [Massilia sp. 9I]
MKRHLSLSILVAALAAASASAFAGSDIVKCIDGAGRVTLTDQPCDGGAATVRLASSPADEGITRAEPYPLAVEHAVLPPAPAQRRHLLPRVKAKPMMRDVATLKAARAQFLLLDAGSKQTTLATLD